jgi:hypothetical protein
MHLSRFSFFTNRWSVSKVETHIMLTSASLNGSPIAATIPVSENSNGPSTFNSRHPRSHLVPAGTALSSIMIESSSLARVMDVKGRSCFAHGGRGESGARRQTARRSLSREIESFQVDLLLMGFESLITSTGRRLTVE